MSAGDDVTAVTEDGTRELVIPTTGEVLSLRDAPTDKLAEALDALKDATSQLREIEGQVKREVLARMDADGVWTAHVGYWTVVGESPDKWDYDAEGLRDALGQLAADGVITNEARANAVAPVTELKVNRRGVNALLKLGGRARAAVEANRTPAQRPRSVRVKRDG